MKKILKLSILLLGALFVLLGCSSEAKSEFVFEHNMGKQKITYVYDKSKDSVTSLTFDISYDIANNKDMETQIRNMRESIVTEINGIEGVTVTQSDSEKELKVTVAVDLKKFKYDDEEGRQKAPSLYSSIHTALVKKNDIYSFEESKKNILDEGFKEAK